MKTHYYSILLFIFSNEALSMAIEAQLKSTAKKGQSLLFAALPIFVLGIAYLYKRGKSEAKERTESLIIGSLLAATAFGWSYFFGR